ncbi:MAG: protoporphyrinogen oxidase [Paludibacteraceae bacterium]|jgi:oxygen-dependent protoporphyrinogen oxidase|nr:protoporphyrinogen oxidase [Paludibacteraceae bacterium]MEE1083274.1 protoporphyrinogen oxidase [Paludibacteraceae bacterium]
MDNVVVIGAGITGLTCAFQLKRRGANVTVLECQDRIGGQINSQHIGDFIFESGPNTGVVKHPEVAELFEQLNGACELETALESSKRRLIWKGDKFHALPSSLASALKTPLFKWYDKIRILGEPWRKKGNDPYESIGSLAERRLGKSYVEYAVDPFLSGVYAGDPYKLPARLALPKLYNLEQDYGSFIRGAIAKAKLPKTERDRKATKKVFSARGGFSNLVNALVDAIGQEHFITSALDIKIMPEGDGWQITFNKDGEQRQINASKVVTTCGAYSLPSLLPFIEKETMDDLSNLYYAPVVQVGVGIKDCGDNQWLAFGGLVPSKEKKQVLGILFPSACFEGRCPKPGATMAYFIGGRRHPEMLNKTDEEFVNLVNETLNDMLKYDKNKKADEIRVFRHEHAIPQYEASSDARLAAVEKVQAQYPTLRIAGNLRDGIGIGDRIKQGFDEARILCGE